jgi:hypothetical protein
LQVHHSRSEVFAHNRAAQKSKVENTCLQRSEPCDPNFFATIIDLAHRLKSVEFHRSTIHGSILKKNQTSTPDFLVWCVAPIGAAFLGLFAGNYGAKAGGLQEVWGAFVLPRLLGGLAGLALALGLAFLFKAHRRSWRVTLAIFLGTPIVVFINLAVLYWIYETPNRTYRQDLRKTEIQIFRHPESAEAIAQDVLAGRASPGTEEALRLAVGESRVSVWLTFKEDTARALLKHYRGKGTPVESVLGQAPFPPEMLREIVQANLKTPALLQRLLDRKDLPRDILELLAQNSNLSVAKLAKRRLQEPPPTGANASPRND